MTNIDQLIGLGMTALLNDHMTREAIYEYIKALTAEHKPRDQWREVYWKQSSERRWILRDLSQQYGMKDKIEKIAVSLVVRAEYDNQSGIGRFIAHLWGDSDYIKSNFASDVGFGHEGNILYESMVANDYMEVVNKFYDVYLRAFEAFTKKTTANE